MEYNIIYTRGFPVTHNIVTDYPQVAQVNNGLQCMPTNCQQKPCPGCLVACFTKLRILAILVWPTCIDSQLCCAWFPCKASL